MSNLPVPNNPHLNLINQIAAQMKQKQFTNRDPLYRLMLGQAQERHGLDRLPKGLKTHQNPYNNAFFLKRNRSVQNPTDPKKWDKVLDLSDPMGDELIVYPIGMKFTRSFGFSNSDYTEYTELCGSENFITPNPKYLGNVIEGTNVVATQCCAADNVKNPTCPLARFGGKNPDGSPILPKCVATYVVAFGVWDDQKGDFVLAECYLKVSSAKSGQLVTNHMAGLLAQGLPVWTNPIKLSLDNKPGKAGNFPKAELVTDPDGNPLVFDPQDYTERFNQMTKEWDQAVQWSLDRANFVPVKEQAQQNNSNPGNASDYGVTIEEPSSIVKTNAPRKVHI